MRLLIVLPTYNEIQNIEQMLHALRQSMPSAEILVVDDGSPDGTAQAARDVSESLGNIEILERTSKSGLGGAYRAGFAWGLERGYTHFVEIDCDFSHNPADVPRLVEASSTAGVVIGSRYVRGGSIPHWPLPRRFLSRWGNRYASWMLSLGVQDSTAGFRVYSAVALKKMDYETVTADGYGFQVEMTYRARRAGVGIAEVPISFTDRERGDSKMSGAIVVEALFLVTLWAVKRPFEKPETH